MELSLQPRADAPEEDDLEAARNAQATLDQELLAATARLEAATILVDHPAPRVALSPVPTQPQLPSKPWKPIVNKGRPERPPVITRPSHNQHIRPAEHVFVCTMCSAEVRRSQISDGGLCPKLHVGGKVQHTPAHAAFWSCCQLPVRRSTLGCVEGLHVAPPGSKPEERAAVEAAKANGKPVPKEEEEEDKDEGTQAVGDYVDIARSPRSVAKLSRTLFERSWGITVAEALDLLRAGADPNWRNPRDGKTVLHYLVATNNTDVVSLMVHNGADLSLADARGKTPLHEAAALCTDVATVEVLLAAGAPLDARDAQGKSAVDVAIDPRVRRAILMKVDPSAVPKKKKKRRRKKKKNAFGGMASSRVRR